MPARSLPGPGRSDARQPRREWRRDRRVTRRSLRRCGAIRRERADMDLRGRWQQAIDCTKSGTARLKPSLAPPTSDSYGALRRVRLTGVIVHSQNQASRIPQHPQEPVEVRLMPSRGLRCITGTGREAQVSNGKPLQHAVHRPRCSVPDIRPSHRHLADLEELVAATGRRERRIARLQALVASGLDKVLGIRWRSDVLDNPTLKARRFLPCA
jgi:hypothetical protein